MNKEFLIILRAACRHAYAKKLNNTIPEVSYAFGDALTFYQLFLDFNIARALANAGYFYPYEIIFTTDEELLKVKGIGIVALREIREWFGPSATTKQISMMNASEILDRMTEMPQSGQFLLPTKMDLNNEFYPT